MTMIKDAYCRFGDDDILQYEIIIINVIIITIRSNSSSTVAITIIIVKSSSEKMVHWNHTTPLYYAKEDNGMIILHYKHIRQDICEKNCKSLCFHAILHNLDTVIICKLVVYYLNGVKYILHFQSKHIRKTNRLFWAIHAMLPYFHQTFMYGIGNKLKAFGNKLLDHNDLVDKRLPVISFDTESKHQFMC